MRLSGEQLDAQLELRATAVGVKPADWQDIKALAAPLKQKNDVTRVHYEHSGRVALLAADIGEFVHLDPKPLFLSGLTHDLGKCLVPCSTLGKTDSWTPQDAKRMRRHVSDSYAMLRDRFDFTAAVVIWHHRFQTGGYPVHLPKALHGYSQGTRLLIIECGRMLAIADVYDALHRSNSKFGGELTAHEIQKKMVQFNPDRQRLIWDLYGADILGND